MKKAGLLLIGLIMMVLFLINVASAALKYSIIYEDTKVREDRCKMFFVLIDPVNLKNDNFKKEITEMVKSLAQKKGRQITIDIFDDRNCLKKYYKNLLQTLPNESTQIESVTEVRHHIARFDDYIGMGTWLSFFPTVIGENNDYKLFGKYHDLVTFNPY